MGSKYLPEEEWKDQKLMAFMFREFRAKEANPEGWTSKLQFWTKNISKWSTNTVKTEFVVNDVRSAFQREDALPEASCIRLVLSNMLRKEELLTFQDFESKCRNAKSSGWISWGISTAVVKPLSWGLSFLSSTQSDPEEEKISDKVSNANAKFVNVNLVKDLAGRLEKCISSSSQLVFPFDVLHSKAEAILGMDQRALDLVLMFLESQGRAKVTVDFGIRVVKFGTEFTELELALLRLESAKELVESEVKKVETEMESLRMEARTCVQEKNTFKAKQLLKRRKRLEGQISKKEGQLDNIDFLLHQISEADSHSTIVHAFKEGAEMLKMAQRSHDLDTTISEVEEALQDQSDILAALSTPIAGATAAVDEDELAEELEELLAQEEAKGADGGMRAKGDEQKTKEVESAQDKELQLLMSRLEKLREPVNSLDDSEEKVTNRRDRTVLGE